MTRKETEIKLHVKATEATQTHA